MLNLYRCIWLVWDAHTYVYIMYLMYLHFSIFTQAYINSDIYIYIIIYIHTHSHMLHVQKHLHVQIRTYTQKTIHILHAETARLEVASLSPQGEVFSKRGYGRSMDETGDYRWWFRNPASYLTYNIYIYIYIWFYICYHTIHINHNICLFEYGR